MFAGSASGDPRRRRSWARPRLQRADRVVGTLSSQTDRNSCWLARAIARGYARPNSQPRAGARMREHHDTVVIGGGQAGLAMSTVLQRARPRARRAGAAAGRGTLADGALGVVALPVPELVPRTAGLLLLGRRPERLRALARDPACHRGLRGEHACAGARAHRGHRAREDDGGFVLSLPDGTIHARRVVVATGPFQRPRSHSSPAALLPTVLQTDPTRYRRPEELPDGAVLVAGSGASGCQIGDELLRAGRAVFLSVSSHRRVPRRFRGKDVNWWLDRMGRFDADDRQLPRAALAPVGRRHRRERRLRRQRAPDGRRRRPGARPGPRCVRRRVDGR